ncbi:ImmA/IrrE family metallo-endopeptidase [Streptomyces echinatus]|uniref:IrrE N-terminal-like domain-containing protein n=1 Tax=Streptomyces echinatus TaxID=67293 RepID=A0A7W9Q013_9ACTN|nr:ImmA/IrrE family metallo-endopeptidase [Streptomyces echinatus]MBB5930891.1 hypothetical protein [Streptomyces echinatus]
MTVDTLVEHLAELYGQPIHLVPLPLPLGSPDGLWVAADGENYIVFEQRLAPVHQHQVILHELGHLICGHGAASVMTPEATQLLVPSLDPGMVRRVLGREHSHSEAEAEAELVGSLIGRQVGIWTAERTWDVPPEARELAARLAALESPSQRRNDE